MVRRLVLTIAAIAMAAGAVQSAPPDQVYTLNCWGCHQPRAQGIAGSVPRLAGSMGYFLHLREGRAYLVEVPGVAASPLSDAEIASVLNWILLTFSRAQLPQDFVPYTTAEVRQLRARRLVDVEAVRRRLAAKLKSMGMEVSR